MSTTPTSSCVGATIFRRCTMSLLLLAFATGVCAQSYPTKPIRAIVPSAPGGPTDVAARVVAEKLGQRWKQQVIVDNGTGANGIIGTETAARAAPDGYTLLMGVPGSMVVSPLLTKVPYDPLKDFIPVVVLKKQTYLVVAHPSVPASSVRELMQLARNPSYKLSHASSGHGSTLHLAGEMLKVMEKVDFVHVPYRGTGPALLAVIGGESSFMFMDMTVVMPHVKANRVKLLAVAAPKRVPELPDIPTMAEAGYPNVGPGGWTIIFVPTGTPKPVVDKLNTEVKGILALADVQKSLGSDASEFGSNTPSTVRTVREERYRPVGQGDQSVGRACRVTRFRYPGRRPQCPEFVDLQLRPSGRRAPAGARGWWGCLRSRGGSARRRSACSLLHRSLAFRRVAPRPRTGEAPRRDCASPAIRLARFPRVLDRIPSIRTIRSSSLAQGMPSIVTSARFNTVRPSP